MLISVLTPVRNEEKHIEEMMASVKAQEHEDWELVVVDDGSTDMTAQLVEDESAADRRIRLVARGQAMGKTAAFNHCFQESHGEVVVLLGGDDRLPSDSLHIRSGDFDPLPAEPTAAFYKIKTFSEDPRLDGMVLPRGRAGSRSGGSITMNRALADTIFPIDPRLPSEDTWLGYLAPALASQIIDSPAIVLEYRIHEGNSNPRNRPFEVMTAASHERRRAWHLLAEAGHVPVPTELREKCAALWKAEQHRYAGDLLGVVSSPGLSLVERLAFASITTPALYAIRNRFYSFFSGRQGR